MNDHHNSRRRAAIVLLIAAFSLLLTFAFLAPRPDAVAMQVGQTVRSTPSLTVISPLQPPTAPHRPRPTRVPMLPITDPTEVAALLARYGDNPDPYTAPRTPEGTGYSNLRAQTAVYPRYLPLILASYNWKGVGDGAYSDVWRLNVGWWYNWGHWTLDSAVIATALPDRLNSYFPMVWCANKPEDGVLPAYWNAQDLASKAARFPGRTWLIYNEPDMPFLKKNNDFFFDQCAKVLCNMVGRTPLPPGTTPTAGPTPTPPLPYRCSYTSTSTATATWYPGLRQEMAKLAADRYAEIYRVIKDADPTARLYCCGNFFTADSPWWSTETGQSWTSFLSRLQWLKQNDPRYPDLALDGVHIHTYPWTRSTECQVAPTPVQPTSVWSGCLRGKLEDYLIAHQSETWTRDKPLLITEYGSLNDSVSANDLTAYLMQPLAGWIGSDGNTLDSGQRGFDGVAWFVTGSRVATHNTGLLEMTATPTAPPNVTPTPIDIYAGTPASTPRGTLGAQWATYEPERFPPTSTPGP